MLGCQSFLVFVRAQGQKCFKVNVLWVCLDAMFGFGMTWCSLGAESVGSQIVPDLSVNFQPMQNTPLA